MNHYASSVKKLCICIVPIVIELRTNGNYKTLLNFKVVGQVQGHMTRVFMLGRASK